MPATLHQIRQQWLSLMQIWGEQKRKSTTVKVLQAGMIHVSISCIRKQIQNLEEYMERMIDGISCISSTGAAAELNTTELKILMLLKQKALMGMELDGEWFVTRDSLDCCKTHGKDMKVEMGCKTYCSTSGCGCKG